MANRVSLFARSLRGYRAGAGAGAQGRMTQEQLAHVLGVTPEAIGKYERSLSYIRGDYEARLADRLGWSKAEIAACRQDWEVHHLSVRQGRYRLLDDRGLQDRYGGSTAELARDITRLVEAEMPEISDEFGANDDIWVPIIERFSEHGACVFKDDTLVAHWGLQFLDEEDRARFRDRAFTEADLSVDRLLRPLLPGTYYAYCPVAIIARGHEAAASLLIGSVQAFLESLARRGVFIEAIGAAAVTAEGRQLCRQLGFVSLGAHRCVARCEVWEWSGAAMARSIIGRRSAILQAACAAAPAGKP